MPIWSTYDAMPKGRNTNGIYGHIIQYLTA